MKPPPSSDRSACRLARGVSEFNLVEDYSSGRAYDIKKPFFRARLVASCFMSYRSVWKSVVVMAEQNLYSSDDSGIVSIKSRLSSSQTVERLKSTFQAHGIKVFAVIDQQAEARNVGLDMPPMVLILFGNPKAGTPLLLARPLSGLDLPLKALVSEAKAGEVMVSFNATQYILKRHALPDELGINIAPIERLIATALSSC